MNEINEGELLNNLTQNSFFFSEDHPVSLFKMMVVEVSGRFCWPAWDFSVMRLAVHLRAAQEFFTLVNSP